MGRGWVSYLNFSLSKYRWNSTARGWALYGKHDEQMAQWLEEAARQRELRRPARA